MRVLIVLIGLTIGAVAGGAAAGFVPPGTIAEAARALGAQFASFSLADLNPFRTAYDGVKAKIQTPATPEELGLRPSPVTPDWSNMRSLTVDPATRNGWAQPLPSMRAAPRH